MTAKERTTSRALELLLNTPEGLRYSVLVRRLWRVLPDIKPGTINHVVLGLPGAIPGEVYKPSRGLFKHTKYRETAGDISAGETAQSSAQQPKEEDFYPGFAEYLTEDLEECTKAVPLGGVLFRDKWGTPDVIGVRKARESDIIKFPTEIVVAEIKTGGGNLVTAFGQAVSYKLFSHKSYIVVPRNSPTEELDRLEALCLTCGLGLILFDSQNVQDPAFAIRVRALKSEPDNFYVNRNLRFVEKDLFG